MEGKNKIVKLIESLKSKKMHGQMTVMLDFDGKGNEPKMNISFPKILEDSLLLDLLLDDKVSQPGKS